MSAPDTNVEKQKKNHRAPLTGISLSLIVVAVLFVGWLLWYVMSPDRQEVGGPVMENSQTDAGTAPAVTSDAPATAPAADAPATTAPATEAPAAGGTSGN